MLLLLARHGETEGNRDKRFQGHMDFPLTPRGCIQAKSLRPPLAGFNLQSAFTSDLRRARETARLAAPSLPLHIHPLFREYSFGVLEGLTLPEVRARYPGLGRLHHRGYPDQPPPGAEEIACFARRLKVCRDYFAGFSREARCLLVGHGRFLNAFLTLLIAGQEAPPYRFPIANAALSALEFKRGRTELLFFNDICHLENS